MTATTALYDRMFSVLTQHAGGWIGNGKGDAHCMCGYRPQIGEYHGRHVAEHLAAETRPDLDTVAKAICEEESRDPIPWDDLSTYAKDRYRHMAFAALRAAGWDKW
jgi:hypothetical protein